MSDAEFIPQEGPKAFIRVWRKVMLDPRAFYSEMPSTGGFENPLIFLGICALIFFVLRVIVGGLFDAINSLLLVILVNFFGPWTLMLASQFVFQGEGDYEGTLRLCAYAGACLILAWIPALWIFALLYSFYLIFLGIEKIHKLDATKAALTTVIGVLATAAIVAYLVRSRWPLV